MDTVVVIDVANVLGSRPDGWWRDRRAAAERLLGGLADLAGREVPGPDGDPLTVAELVAVTEGQARDAQAPEAESPEAEGPHGLRVSRARGEGDTTVVEEAQDAHRRGARVLVVTADRGLRQRLPEECLVTGPSWLNELLGR